MKTPARLLVVLFFAASSAGIQSQDVSSLKDTFRVSGSLDARLVAYSAAGIGDRRSPFSYILGGNIVFSKGEFNLPLSVTFSEQERKFSQPFNQFGIAPQYKWFTAYLGYQNMSWSNYTMAGHQMMGAGFEAKPGKFVFSAMYGRLKRAVPFDSAKLNQQLPSYKRNGLAIRAGYGTEDNRMELTFLKASDDPETLITVDSGEIQYTPGQNSAASLKAKFKLFQGFSIFGEGAVSVFTRNVASPEFEGAPTSPVSKVFLVPNISTQVYTAINGGFNYQYKSFFLSGLYKIVAPDYQSMGAYFQENDIQSTGVNTGVQLWKGKGNLSAAFLKTSDNILGKKMATTHRLMPLCNFSWNNLKHFGIDISGSAVATTQSDGNTKLSDTIRQDMLNPMLSITPRWTFADTVRVKTFLISVMQQFLQDNNTFTSEFSEYQNTNINLNYSLTKIASFTTIFASVNINRMQTAARNTNIFGMQGGWNKGYKKNTFPVNASAGFSVSSLNKTFNIAGGAGYQAKERHHFAATLTAMQNFASEQGQRNYREITAVFSYTYNFGK